MARALRLGIFILLFSKYLVYIAGGSKVTEWRSVEPLDAESRHLPGNQRVGRIAAATAY
jgi:hypothetical protein